MSYSLLGHGAANVTLGIPRLREIVMTASQKPKTPSMTMKVRPGTSPEDVSMFCKRASRVTLSQVVDNVTVQEQLRTEGDARRTQFTIDLNFYPKHEYQQEYDIEPEEIVAAFGVKFPLTLKKEMLAEMKKLDADLKSQMAQLGHGKKVKAKEGEAGNDDEDGEVPRRKKDDDEGSEVGDGDADDAKHSRQRKQQATYESDEEENEEEVGAYDDAAIEAEYASGDENADETPKKPKSTSFKELVSRASNLFQRHLQQCISFSFDESKSSFKLEVIPSSIFCLLNANASTVPSGHAQVTIRRYCGACLPDYHCSSNPGHYRLFPSQTG